MLNFVKMYEISLGTQNPSRVKSNSWKRIKRIKYVLTLVTLIVGIFSRRVVGLCLATRISIALTVIISFSIIYDTRQDR